MTNLWQRAEQEDAVESKWNCRNKVSWTCQVASKKTVFGYKVSLYKWVKISALNFHHNARVAHRDEFLDFNVCFGLWFIIATICWGRKCFCLAPFKLSKPIVINCVLKQRDREEVLWNVSQSLKIRAEGLEKINVRDAIKNQNTKLTFVHFLATVKQMFRHPHSSSSERRSNACSFCFWVLETVSTIVWDLISFWMEIYGATKEFRFEESLSTFD